MFSFKADPAHDFMLDSSNKRGWVSWGNTLEQSENEIRSGKETVKRGVKWWLRSWRHLSWGDSKPPLLEGESVCESYPELITRFLNIENTITY